MDFIDEVIGKAQKAGQFVADKAMDAKDYVTLEYKTATLRNSLNDKYKELGKLTYAAKTSAVDNGAQCDALITEIDGLIAELKKAQLELSGHKKICSACGEGSGDDATFCKKCGARL